MGFLKKTARGFAVLVLALIVWVWARDDRAYLCRPGDATRCKEAQFGSFSNAGLCSQAAEAFCFSEHFRFGNKGGFACVQNGDGCLGRVLQRNRS